jgi:hypothetical protein
VKKFEDKKFCRCRIMGMFEFRTPVYVIRDPKLAKKLAVKDFDYFVDHRVVLDENTDKLFGKSLFSLQGQKWRGEICVKTVYNFKKFEKYDYWFSSYKFNCEHNVNENSHNTTTTLPSNQTQSNYKTFQICDRHFRRCLRDQRCDKCTNL